MRFAGDDGVADAECRRALAEKVTRNINVDCFCEIMCVRLYNLPPYNEILHGTLYTVKALQFPIEILTSCEFLCRSGRSGSLFGRHDPLQRGRLLGAARLHGGVGRRLGSLD